MHIAPTSMHVGCPSVGDPPDGRDQTICGEGNSIAIFGAQNVGSSDSIVDALISVMRCSIKDVTTSRDGIDDCGDIDTVGGLLDEGFTMIQLQATLSKHAFAARPDMLHSLCSHARNM